MLHIIQGGIMKPFSLLIFICLIMSLTSPILSQDHTIIPLKLNNTDYYPLYKILNILHLERHYDFYSQKILIKDKGRYLSFFLDEDTIYFERQSVLLKSCPTRHEGIIYIPKEMIDLFTQWKRNDYLFAYNDSDFSIDKKEEVIYKEDKAVAKNNDRTESKDIVKINPSEKIEKNHKKITTSSPHKIKVIVIDAGHGGKDPGAIGQKGLREKKVVLSVALKLRDYLNNRLKNVKIVMTRNNDTFIPLTKRAKIANQYIKKDNTGLFISIHANASMNKKSKGTETFVLSPVASDDEARAVAAMENGMIETKKRKVEPITKILTGMISYENIRESIQLAKLIEEGYRTHLKAPARKKPVKKALFYVLEGTLMPAVLTEIGFITNKKEEKLLRSSAYQKKIAESIGKGMIKFIKWYDANNGFIQ